MENCTFQKWKKMRADFFIHDDDVMVGVRMKKGKRINFPSSLKLPLYLYFFVNDDDDECY